MVKKNTSEVAPVEESQDVVVEESSELGVVETTFKEIYDSLAQHKQQASDLTTKVRSLEKLAKKLEKESQKKSKPKNKAPREPSGITKPALLSKELCTFLQKPAGTEMARTEVTKHLSAYIKENKLQEPDDKRKIKPDAKLSKLLNLKKGDEVTYFNLQTYMKPLFTSAASSTK